MGKSSSCCEGTAVELSPRAPQWAGKSFLRSWAKFRAGVVEACWRARPNRGRKLTRRRSRLRLSNCSRGRMRALSDVSGFDSVLSQVIANRYTGPASHARRIPAHAASAAAGSISASVSARAFRYSTWWLRRNGRGSRRTSPRQNTNPNHGAGRPVFDKTGLTGFYDFEIEWLRALFRLPRDLTRC